MHSRSSAYRWFCCLEIFLPWILARRPVARDLNAGGGVRPRPTILTGEPLRQNAFFVRGHSSSTHTLRQKARSVRRHYSSEGTLRQKALVVRRQSSSHGNVRQTALCPSYGTVRQEPLFVRIHRSSEGTLRRKELLKS